MAVGSKYSLRARALIWCGITLPLAGEGEVIENSSVESYPVALQPGASLFTSLNSASPVREKGRTYFGHTEWNIRWNYRWRSEPSGRCTITSVSTQLDVTTVLPETTSATEAGKAEFEKFRDTLVKHEDGHKQISIAAAHAIDRAIASLPTMSNCKLLEQAADRRGNELLDNAQKQEVAYDRTTEHGCRQGACLTH